eukprot:COSAG01_NODE_847_length_13139_cov_35.539647_6_plen_144_part_00
MCLERSLYMLAAMYQVKIGTQLVARYFVGMPETEIQIARFGGLALRPLLWNCVVGYTLPCPSTQKGSLSMQAASAHMTKSLALDPNDPSRGDLLPSRDGIPPRVASIIWHRNFPSLCLIHLHTDMLKSLLLAEPEFQYYNTVR